MTWLRIWMPMVKKCPIDLRLMRAKIRRWVILMKGMNNMGRRRR